MRMSTAPTRRHLEVVLYSTVTVSYSSRLFLERSQWSTDTNPFRSQPLTEHSIGRTDSISSWNSTMWRIEYVATTHGSETGGRKDISIPMRFRVILHTSGIGILHRRTLASVILLNTESLLGELHHKRLLSSKKDVYHQLTISDKREAYCLLESDAYSYPDTSIECKYSGARTPVNMYAKRKKASGQCKGGDGEEARESAEQQRCACRSDDYLRPHVFIILPLIISATTSKTD
ncbi:hypothetical protein Tco_0715579 [Tanacetum coccineum]